ncbi:MAG: hypothetical protein U9N84_04825 [Actinomycetota bacterium]|nr:hypothetical protein [Actinomycetota bacterium]
MAERSTSFVSLLAAVVVAVAGLIPVIWLLTSPAEDSVISEGVAVVDSTATPTEVTTVVVEPIPQLDVDELDPAIVRVLQANGYAEQLGQTGLDGELPDAVTRLLIERGAVLTVVEGDPGSQEDVGEEGN